MTREEALDHLCKRYFVRGFVAGAAVMAAGVLLGMFLAAGT